MEERRLGAREGRRGEGEAAQLLEPASCIALASRISDLELRTVAAWRSGECAVCVRRGGFI